MTKTVQIPDGMEVYFKPVASEQVSEKKPKIGYKGFNKDLKCKDHQFIIGEVAVKPEKESLTICSADGFHYCNSLKDVFNHYANSNENRFCEVEILGNFKDESDKSVTTSLKILRELPQDEVDSVVYVESINLETIKQIQSYNPTYHIGGSAGLFLHGILLNRIKTGWNCDLDFVTPFYTIPEGSDTDKISMGDSKRSANDFDEAFVFNDVHCDVRVDNRQKYDLVEYQGFKFKVSKLETIMAAKFKYAMNGQNKHKSDVYEICGKKNYNKETKIFESEDLPY